MRRTMIHRLLAVNQLLIFKILFFLNSIPQTHSPYFNVLLYFDWKPLLERKAVLSILWHYCAFTSLLGLTINNEIYWIQVFIVFDISKWRLGLRICILKCFFFYHCKVRLGFLVWQGYEYLVRKAHFGQQKAAFESLLMQHKFSELSLVLKTLSLRSSAILITTI